MLPGDRILAVDGTPIRHFGHLVQALYMVPAGQSVHLSLQRDGADFEATVYRRVPTVTYASAVHVALVQVDVETGMVQIRRYVVAHDCGRIINPMIVDGQIAGGVAQGIGGGLYEELVYNADGQFLSGSLIDYLLPTAVEVPRIELIHLDFPSPRNPLGV